VEEAFRLGKILAVEAGTGVGKSLAYGLPAAAFATSSGERVVLSTATINLQEQLTRKDLPVVARALGRELKVVLVKGRGNYLCRRRLAERVRQRVLLSEGGEQELLLALAAWAERGQDGTRSELPLPVSEEVWEEVCSDADACLGGRCGHRRECFFAMARQQAEQAEILVVNHHLLFADLAMRLEQEDWSKRAVLPPFSYAVLDEAHELEDAAAGFFGIRLTRLGALRQVARLLAPGRKGGGLLLQVAAEIATLGGPLSDGRALRLVQESAVSVSPLAQAARRDLESAFDALAGLALRAGGEAGVGEARLRLTPAVYAGADWRVVREEFGRASGSVAALADWVDRLVTRLTDLSEEDGRILEARAGVRRLKELQFGISRLVCEDPDPLVRWVEVPRRARGRAAFCCAPIDVAERMNDTLLSPMKAVVLTSATLSVGESFDFFSRRIGLDRQPGERVRTLLAKSPFDYRAQARLVVPYDLCSPGDPLFEQLLPEAVFQSIAVSGGRALVLFTSWSLMSRVHELVAGRLQALGIAVLCQGQAPRDHLLRQFREDETSVLFGTDSFWQGVDVIGPALRNVVITRLPFDVPDEPLLQARMEVIERAGGSAFDQLMLPRAVLKLKQGFGRLIRARSDWGSVVVLDRRLVERSYGRRFLDSLPEVQLITGSLDEVCGNLARFFSERGLEAPSRVVPVD
jgi:ATP-dependent DNA helicase DinG